MAEDVVLKFKVDADPKPAQTVADIQHHLVTAALAHNRLLAQKQEQEKRANRGSRKRKVEVGKPDAQRRRGPRKT